MFNLKRRGGFRNIGRIGRTRERLAEKITAMAVKQWGHGWYVDPEDLSRNNPCYVNVSKDGVSWDGYVSRSGQTWKKHIHSWQSMGVVLKGDAVLTDDGELFSTPRKRDPR
jgi:hypothetical protein